MGVTLERVQNKFACIIGELCSEPVVLSKFAIWLDLRLAEYKAKGSISLDCSGENPDPFWLNGHEKEESQNSTGGGNPPDYPYRATPQRTSHSPSPRYSSAGGTRTILPESASKDSLPLDRSPFKTENENQSDVFPVSLHRVEVSHDRKRAATDPVSDLNTSKVRRIADEISSALVEQAVAANTEFTPTVLQVSDDDFGSSNDDTDNDLTQSRSQSSSANLSKGDHSLTFPSHNTSIADDSSFLQHTSFQSTPSDTSVLGHNSELSSAGVCTTSTIHSGFGTSERIPHPSIPERYYFTQRARSRIINPETKTCNTIGHLSGAVGYLERWLRIKFNEQRCIENIPPHIFNKYLVDFYANIKKPSGDDYDPVAFTSLRSYIERFLKEQNYPSSIIKGVEFLKSQDSFRERRKTLPRPLNSAANSSSSHIPVNIPDVTDTSTVHMSASSLAHPGATSGVVSVTAMPGSNLSQKLFHQVKKENFN